MDDLAVADRFRYHDAYMYANAAVARHVNYTDGPLPTVTRPGGSYAAVDTPYVRAIRQAAAETCEEGSHG